MASFSETMAKTFTRLLAAYIVSQNERKTITLNLHFDFLVAPSASDVKLTFPPNTRRVQHTQSLLKFLHDGPTPGRTWRRIGCISLPRPQGLDPQIAQKPQTCWVRMGVV